MLGNSIEYGSKFTHKPMQDLASFSRTMNMATQAIAKTNANLSDTGTAACVINGVHIAALTVESGRTLANDKQFTIWVTATAYTAAANDCRYVEDGNGNKQWYMCIADHTSAAGTKPGQPDSAEATWRTYWTESSNKAENAVGQVGADGYTRYYLCLADKLGVMTTVIADNGLQLTAAQELVIPHFDPEVFVAIGLYTLTGTGDSTWGTTDDNAQVGETQWIGPCYPTDLVMASFNNEAARDLIGYSRSMNMATQAVAKANADMANTGNGAAVINGVVYASLTTDAALSISADTQLGEWVTATAYTALGGARTDVRYVEDDNGYKQWYTCILAHTSSAATKPGQKDSVNASWRTYWKESCNRAIPAVGDTVITLYSRYYAVLADAQGVMTTVLAGNIDLDATVLAEGPQIPRFDPEVFVCIGYILKNADTANDVWGTDNDNGEVTITQCVGPVYPNGAGLTDTIVPS